VGLIASQCGIDYEFHFPHSILMSCIIVVASCVLRPIDGKTKMIRVLAIGEGVEYI